MGMTVQVRTERGRILVQYFDTHHVLANAVTEVWHDDLERFSSWHILQYIDQYGDTALNWPQLDRFLVEVQWLIDTETDPRAVSVLQTYRGLALFCGQRVHTYLWMLGD